MDRKKKHFGPSDVKDMEETRIIDLVLRLGKFM